MYQWPRRPLLRQLGQNDLPVLPQPQKLAAARSKTKTKPLRGKRAQHRSPATPDVHEPDFVPDSATRPRKRSIWHEIDADPVSDAAPKDIHHGSPQTLCLRLCYGKQMRVCRLRLRRSRQSFSTRLARRCLSCLCHLLGQLTLPTPTARIEHQTPSPNHAAPGPRSGRDCPLLSFHRRGLQLMIFLLHSTRGLSVTVPEPRVGGTGSRHHSS